MTTDLPRTLDSTQQMMIGNHGSPMDASGKAGSTVKLQLDLISKLATPRFTI